MLGLKLNHVSKRGPSTLAMVLLHSQLHQAIEKCRLHNEHDRETWCIMTISVMCSWISHIWFWTKCRILQQFSSQFSVSFQFQSFVFGHLYLIVQSVVGLALNRRRSFAEHNDIPAHWRIHASLCIDMMFQHIEKGFQRILFQPYYYYKYHAYFRENVELHCGGICRHIHALGPNKSPWCNTGDLIQCFA